MDVVVLGLAGASPTPWQLETNPLLLSESVLSSGHDRQVGGLQHRSVFGALLVVSARNLRICSPAPTTHGLGLALSQAAVQVHHEGRMPARRPSPGATGERAGRGPEETVMTRISSANPDRRALLKVMGLGAAGIAGAPLLVACTGQSEPRGAQSTPGAPSTPASLLPAPEPAGVGVQTARLYGGGRGRGQQGPEVDGPGGQSHPCLFVEGPIRHAERHHRGPAVAPGRPPDRLQRSLGRPWIRSVLYPQPPQSAAAGLVPVQLQLQQLWVHRRRTGGRRCHEDDLGGPGRPDFVQAA
jgi:hypothetical protein